MKFIDEEYTWNNISLFNFLYEEGNIPFFWKEFFEREDIRKEINYISENIKNEIDKGIVVYPEINNVFRAFYLMNPKNIKLGILALDPYHNGSATGLCFDVKKGNSINPSLKNIYKELKNEGYTISKEDGNLSGWKDKGIFLINTALTVRKGEAESHLNYWFDFTKKLLTYLSEVNAEDDLVSQDILWLLFGTKAHSFSPYFKNYLKTSHPSGFSANTNSKNFPAFIGSNVFKKAEEITGINFNL